MNIEKKISIISKIILLALFLLYSFGFLTWNIYLNNFGFYEYNFIETNYISAGFLSCLFLFIIYGVVFHTLQKFFKFSLNSDINVYICIVVFSICIVLFPNYIFSRIPRHWLGGGMQQVSILGAPEQILYLNNFDIDGYDNGDKASVQSKPVCLIYQNDKYSLFGVYNTITNKRRVISIENDRFTGLQYKGGDLGKNYFCDIKHFRF